MDFHAPGMGENAGGISGGDAAAGKDDDPSAGAAVQRAKHVRALHDRRALARGQDAVATEGDELLQKK